MTPIIRHGRMLERSVARSRMRVADLGRVGDRIGVKWSRAAARSAPRDSGRLAKSLGYNSTVVGKVVTITIASDAPYANIQQYGGTIVGGSPRSKIAGKKPKMLAVPLCAAARAMIRKMGAGESLRDQPDLKMIVANGRAFLVLKSADRRKQRGKHAGGRQRGTLMFVLKESVTLDSNPPPTGYVPLPRSQEVREYIRDAFHI